MHRMEEKLALWRKLYVELGEAQVRLNTARAQSPGDPSLQILSAEVIRLQAESDHALSAVHSEMDRFKTNAKTPAARPEPLHPEQ